LGYWNNLFKQKWKTDRLGNEVLVSKETYDRELNEKVKRAIHKLAIISAGLIHLQPTSL